MRWANKKTRRRQRHPHIVWVLLLGLIVVAWRLYSNYGWWYALWLGPGDPPRSCVLPRIESPPDKDYPPKIGILCLRDTGRPNLARYAQLERFAEAALENKKRYASRHSYALVVADANAGNRPAPWAKLPALRRALPQFDWLLYIDGDALFANPEPRLEALVDDAYDVVISEDWGGYNTGVFLVKNSSFVAKLLDDMWDAGTRYGLAKPNKWWRHEMPFEFEQRALHFLTRSETWQASADRYGLPTVPPDVAAPIRDRIKVLPQCALNSYLVRPRLLPQDARHRAARYARGDFVVHLAGHKGANKAALLEYALDHLVRREV
ncbi:hypothetical protein CTAYLR_003055 [Chrysophaeum taylorii]|uniref:Galactosyl transferase GMA12/MNN10 family protein n=1 Tax=Chrysophaeum taylorii TaxID=2483200 RepID=A0AAD7U7B9_9STRA|nr:hypothetical protein CTAYLR_003055 [Chrysophaeum taylorii]